MVTGGNGFVGSYICRELANTGYRVIAYDLVPTREETRFIQGSDRHDIQYVDGQTTDLSRLISVCRERNVQRIVHTAGFVEVGGAIAQPYRTYDINVMGSIAVFETARLLGLGRIIVTSSNGVYQEVTYEPMDEDHPVFSTRTGCPSTHYGASKLAAEVIGLTYFRHNAVDVVFLRISAVYGFGMRLPLYVKPMVENAVLGRPTEFPTGAEMKRDYTYAKDVARAIRLALEVDGQRLEHRVLNVSGGRTYTAHEAAEIVCQLVPGAQVSVGSGLTTLEQTDIRTRGALDLRRASEVLGYEPRFDLTTGIQDYINVMKEFIEYRDTSLLII